MEGIVLENFSVEEDGMNGLENYYVEKGRWKE